MTDRLMFLAQRETQGVPRDVAEKVWSERMKISDDMVFVAREAFTFADDSPDVNKDSGRWRAAIEAAYPLIEAQVREECARIAASTVRHPVGREDEYVVGTAIDAAAAIRAGGKDD